MKFGVNPFMMGLLGGLGDLTQGYGQYLNQQRMGAMQMALENYKQQNAMSLEKLKGQNDLLIKSLQAEANQRTYTVNKAGPDGSIQTYQMRNVLDPTTHSFTPMQVGDPVPYVSPMDRTNATNATRKQIANMQIEAANSRAASTFSKNAALQSELDARQSLRETGLNKRSAAMMTNQAMREFDKSDSGTQQQLLQPYGIDPNDPKARAKYRQAVLNDNLQTLGAGASQGSPPEVRYDSQGNAFIKGPDGKPVPYNPGAAVSDGSQDAGVADNNGVISDPNSMVQTPYGMMPAGTPIQQLAMDQTVGSPEYQGMGDDSSGDGSQDGASGPGLLGDGSGDQQPTDDGSDAENDGDSDDQQGLLNGQYA